MPVAELLIVGFAALTACVLASSGWSARCSGPTVQPNGTRLRQHVSAARRRAARCLGTPEPNGDRSPSTLVDIKHPAAR